MHQEQNISSVVFLQKIQSRIEQYSTENWPVLYNIVNVMNDQEKLTKSTPQFNMPKMKFNFFSPNMFFYQIFFFIIDSGNAHSLKEDQSMAFY